jgi:UDP:flavonoid glycosyltransferase YjiC (YdhE family)
MLVVPWSHDQPDNADRVARLGAGRTLARTRFNARTAARELARLLGDPAHAARAAEAGRRVRAEDGVAAACAAIEALLAARDRITDPAPVA